MKNNSAISGNKMANTQANKNDDFWNIENSN